MKSFFSLFFRELIVMFVISSHDHIEIMVNSAGELLFFRHREGPWMPTLRLLHKCKTVLCIYSSVVKVVLVNFFVSVS